MTHPFHPWRGRRFQFADCRQCWGEWRVFYYTDEDEMAYFPRAWTDVESADPFVVLAGGQAVMRFEDLVRMVKLLEGVKEERVKKIRPEVSR